MSNETLVKCGHPPCQCLVEAEQTFCSSACASARGPSSGPCLCGHADCVAETRLGDEESDPSQPSE